MKPLIIMTALAASITATVVLAGEGHEHATGVVKERMILMSTMGEKLLAMSRRLRANTDLSKVTEDSKAIGELAGKITAQFPRGSTQPPTEAKPVIWKDWEDFNSKVRSLQAEAEKLAKADVSDGKALRGQFRKLAFTCDGCHEKYRLTKN